MAGSAVLVRERAQRSRRGGRDRRRRTRRCARRLRVADARGRAQERHAASRPPRGAPRTGARVHPLARRVVCLDLQVAGRHRPARLARLPPQRNMGWLLRLLRLRHRRVPGADAPARRRSADRAAGARRQSGIGRVRDELGALRQRSAHDHVGADARAQRTSRAVRCPLLPDRQRADEQRLYARALRGHRQSLRKPAAADRARCRHHRLRSEAVERHGVEREGDRSRRQQLRRARRPQLRVRKRSLRVRRAAHPRLSREAARLRARVGAPRHQARRARMEPEPDLRLARRPARRRQPDPVRVADPGIDDDVRRRC